MDGLDCCRSSWIFHFNLDRHRKTSLLRFIFCVDKGASPHDETTKFFRRKEFLACGDFELAHLLNHPESCHFGTGTWIHLYVEDFLFSYFLAFILRYLNVLESNPLITKSITSVLINSTADFLTQVQYLSNLEIFFPLRNSLSLFRFF